MKEGLLYHHKVPNDPTQKAARATDLQREDRRGKRDKHASAPLETREKQQNINTEDKDALMDQPVDSRKGKKRRENQSKKAFDKCVGQTSRVTKSETLVTQLQVDA